MAKTYETKFLLTATEASAFKAAFKNAGNTLRQTERQAKTLERAMNQLHKQFAKGNIDEINYEKSINRVAKAYDKQRRAAEALSKVKRIDTMQQKVNAVHDKAGGVAIKAGMAAAGTLGFPIKDAMAFEDVMADVRKVVDFDTPEQFKQMGEDIMKLSERIPMASNEIAKLVAAGGQAGIAREELLAFAEDAGKMGVAFDMSAEEAGQTMAEWRTAFKMTQPEVVELADKVNYLSNTTAASSSKISDIVSRVGPLGAVGGMASGQIAALGAAMAAAGTDSEVAATGIQKIILGLTAGESATDTQQMAFQELGLDATEMAKRMQTDAGGALQDVFERLSKIDKFRQAAVLKNLFGGEGIKAIAPLLTNLDNLKQNMADVNDVTKYGNSMGKEFSARMETTTASLELAKNATHNLSITVGNQLLPVIKSVLDGVTPMIQGLATWSKEHKTLSTVIVGGIGGLLATTVAISGFIWIVTGIASPILGAVKAYKSWKAAQIIAEGATKRHTIAVAANTVATNVHKGAVKGAALAQKAWNASLVAGRGLLNAGKIIAYRAAVLGTAVATKAAAVGQRMLNKALLLGRNAYSAAKVLAYKGAMIAVRGVTAAWTAAQWLLNAAMTANPIGLVVVGIAGLIAIGYLLIKNWDTVKQWFSTLWNNPKEAINQFCSFMKSTLGEAWDWAMQKWEELKSFFANPIKGTIDIVKNVVGGGDAKENYAGGIYPKGAFLTWFAEKSPEAAIPIDGSQRAISLWQRVGQMLGVYNKDKQHGAMDVREERTGFVTADNQQNSFIRETQKQIIPSQTVQKLGVWTQKRQHETKKVMPYNRMFRGLAKFVPGVAHTVNEVASVVIDNQHNIPSPVLQRPVPVAPRIVPQRSETAPVIMHMQFNVTGEMTQKVAKQVGETLKQVVEKVLDERNRKERRRAFA